MLFAWNKTFSPQNFGLPTPLALVPDPIASLTRHAHDERTLRFVLVLGDTMRGPCAQYWTARESAYRSRLYLRAFWPGLSAAISRHTKLITSKGRIARLSFPVPRSQWPKSTTPEPSPATAPARIAFAYCHSVWCCFIARQWLSPSTAQWKGSQIETGVHLPY